MLAHTHTHKRLCPMAACDAIAMQIAPCNFAHKLSRCDASFVSRARHWERRKEPLDFHSSLTLAGSTRLCPFCAALSAAPRTICMLNGVYLMPRHFGASTLRLSRSPARECDCVFFFFWHSYADLQIEKPRLPLRLLSANKEQESAPERQRARELFAYRAALLHSFFFVCSRCCLILINAFVSHCLRNLSIFDLLRRSSSSDGKRKGKVYQMFVARLCLRFA